MTLQLTANNGKNLPNIEIIGKVDPYLIGNFQGVKRKTPHLKNDLNPVWNHMMEWDLGTKPLEHGDFVEIVVRDWERVGRHRLIGSCTVSLKDVIRSKTRETQCTMQLKDGANRLTTGEIELNIKYIAPKGAGTRADVDVSGKAGKKPTLDETDGDAGTDTDPAALGTMPPESAVEGGGAGGFAFKHPKKNQLSSKPRDFQIRVKIWEARQLFGTNINPVCRVTLVNNCQVTRVKKSTNKPYWDELFFYQVNMSPSELFDEFITFQVLDSHLVRSDALIGAFQVDVGSVYQNEGHAYLNKWLLLTSIEDASSSSAKGYIMVSIAVISQGDDVPIFTRADPDFDIEANLLHPAGVDIRQGTFNLKVYQAEDLPQMDAACFEGVKKVLHVGEENKELVDPYVSFSFAGKTLKTDVKYTNDHPEWFQELRLPIRFPSMCERLKVTLRDWDRLSTDDYIATAYLDISQIGSRGDDGFLPTFGPCFLNFYGSPREFGTFSDDYDNLNRGRGEGVAYRGRVLIALDTELGDPPDEQIVTISSHEQLRVEKYRRLRKYHLYAAFINATMISETDRPVEFEVSIGNSGNKLDGRVTPQPSTTQPTNAVFDGNHYYFLPWRDTKPLVVVTSEWEDISFRLEPLNIILHYITRLGRNMENVRTTIKSGASEKDVATALIRTIDKLIEDCSTPLPDFGGMKTYANELDNRRFEYRRRIMLEIVQRARVLRDRAIEVDDTLDEIEEYMLMLKDLAVEPQNSLPDVVVWMMCGAKRIAYIRVPAYDVLYSARSRDACGKYCGQTFSYFLKYLKEGGKDGFSTIPAMVRMKLWLGLESHSENFRKGVTDSNVAVCAETYENQVNMMGQWSDKGIISRPKFSDSTGKLHLPKNKFLTPEGWSWDGDWFVNLDASLLYDADAGLNHYLEDCFEQQIRYIPGGDWNPASTPYTNVKGDPVPAKDEIKCPPGWQWDDAWVVDVNRACDEEGYEYCVESTSATWTPSCKTYHMCRRKRWVRPRSLVKGFKVEEVKEEAVGEGWEYAPIFNMRFHATERKMDMVRRRRWHRKMLATSDKAANFFSLRRTMTEEKDKQEQPVPRIFLIPKETHKYQLRAYLFQARDLVAADSDSFSDPFAFVSFLFRSQRTHYIRHTLTPTWDETRIFEEIIVHGDPRFLARHPPDVVVEVFDYDAYVNDEFLGRAIIKPMVKLEPSDRRVSRLAWHTLFRGKNEAGELLASFELYLAKKHSDLPYMPPMKHDRYVVPSGIRPVMQRTAIEILCWGVRNMARFMSLSVSSPSIEFEIGGKVCESKVISNVSVNPNFDSPIIMLIVDLPREELYTPPINIKVRDHRAFGRKPIVGMTMVSGLSKYRRLDSIHLSMSDDEEENGNGIPALTLTDPNSQEFTVIDVPDHADVAPSPAASPSKEGKKRRKKFSAGGFIKLKWWQRTKSVDPETVAEEEIDWWSKYYASKNEPDKCISYVERGYDKIQILPYELEKHPGYQEFTDFCDTFDLVRGKAKDKEESKSVGQFKGSFKIYPLPPDSKKQFEPMFFKMDELPPSRPVECLVRVYVVRAHQLCPQDRNGLSDPYIIASLGKKVLDDVENYIPNTLDPFFGRLFEMKTVLPLKKDLKVTVMDKDLLSRDDIIGETVIDLENRYLTKYRATCGLPATYNISGPNIWRDANTPRNLLSDYCKRMAMGQPVYEDGEPPTSITVDGTTYNLLDFEVSKIQNEHWGPADQRLALYVLLNQNVVKEHVETRDIYNPGMPDLSQGKLEMWVDIFPLIKGITPGPPFDITVRQAKKFELRCVIWNTKDVILDETSITGERMSDIYVKGWLAGQDEKQETDVHYRSLNGEGNFNWRFVFEMHYIPPEHVLVVKKKEHFWSVMDTEIRVPPTLVVQIWDNDKFSADDFLGSLELELNKMVPPVKEASQSSLEQLPDCATDKNRVFKYISLFEQKRVKGWWPCYSSDGDGSEKILAGKVEMELEVVDEDEVVDRPTAPARDEPNQHPKLEEPKRPETSFLWFTSPWKSIRFIIWYNYKWYIIIGLLLILLIIFLVLFIYSVPGASVSAIFG